MKLFLYSNVDGFGCRNQLLMIPYVRRKNVIILQYFSNRFKTEPLGVETCRKLMQFNDKMMMA